MIDPSSELGAARLVAEITAYWRTRPGGDRVVVKAVPASLDKRGPSFVIRSNLKNALPPRAQAQRERTAA